MALHIENPYLEMADLSLGYRLFETPIKLIANYKRLGDLFGKIPSTSEQQMPWSLIT